MNEMSGRRKKQKTDFRKAFQEITADLNYFVYVWVARGAGFEQVKNNALFQILFPNPSQFFQFPS